VCACLTEIALSYKHSHPVPQYLPFTLATSRLDSVASIPWDLALTSETNLLMLLRVRKALGVVVLGLKGNATVVVLQGLCAPVVV